MILVGTVVMCTVQGDDAGSETRFGENSAEHNILHGIEYHGDVLGICGTRIVWVNDFLGVLVLLQELLLDELQGWLVRPASIVLREADRQVHFLDLLGEQVLLVQEEDHRCVDEPLGVAYFFEKLERLVHSVGCVVFL